MRFESFREMLAHWAAQTPDAPALRFDRGGGQCCSYRELLSLVDGRAGELRARGATSLGVFCDGGIDCVITLLAAPQAGLQTVLLDENAADDLLPELLRATDVDSLFGDSELVEALSSHLTPGVEGGAGRMLFFTSGTTEAAKAVALTERSLMASAYNGGALLPLNREDTLLCILPLHHVFGFVCGLLWGLSCGAAVALGRGPRHYADDCAFFRPTALSAVPALLGFLLRQQALNPELALILVGAGDCPPPLLRTAGALGIRVSFGYGLTETSSGVALSLGDDPYRMTVCPEDTVTLAEDGEILVHAPTCVMEGYYRRPEDTAAVLRDGVLHTGDLGRLDEQGRLTVTGRKKEMLVLPDGTKLFLPELEQELSAALGTGELCVLLVDSAPALVLQGREEQREQVLRRLGPVMARRPRGQQLRRVIFREAPLPRTTTGKIKRWELQQEVGKP